MNRFSIFTIFAWLVFLFLLLILSSVLTTLDISVIKFRFKVMCRYVAQNISRPNLLERISNCFTSKPTTKALPRVQCNSSALHCANFGGMSPQVYHVISWNKDDCPHAFHITPPLWQSRISRGLWMTDFRKLQGILNVHKCRAKEGGMQIKVQYPETMALNYAHIG